MDNWGPNSNKSSFFITLGDAEFMNELHVVFGKILNGMNVLREIEQEKTYPKGEVILVTVHQLYFEFRKR